LSEYALSKEGKLIASDENHSNAIIIKQPNISKEKQGKAGRFTLDSL
jgi:hypothetical protein